MVKKDQTVKIVICGDKNIEIGLHVLLYSLLANSKGASHRIYFINDAYEAEDIDKLCTTLTPFKDKYELVSIPFKSKLFNNYKGLHGNKYTYTKIVIANLVDEDKVIYIDLDMVVNIDISKLLDIDMGEYIVAANPECKIHQCLEADLYNSLNLNCNSLYFNCGTLLINLKAWRENNITEKCIEFANSYPKRLKTGDQTILNFCFNENFLILDDKYNIRIKNSIKPSDYMNTEGIYHFFGRPKPWDLFAEYIHPHYKIFKNVLAQTYFRDYRSTQKIDKKSIHKFFSTYKSYIKTILRLDL